MKIDCEGFEGNIDTKGIAKEILQWLIDCVEEYIDNKETVFPIYFPVNSEVIQKMEKTNALGNIYLKVLEGKNSDSKKRKVIDRLDEIVKEIKEIMSKDKESLENLYKRMVWYYEMVGFNKATGPIIQEMEGYVAINQFVFESIGLDICVTKKYQKLTKDGRLIESDKAPEIVKQEHVPEGFTIEIEIKKWPKITSTSLL